MSEQLTRPLTKERLEMIERGLNETSERQNTPVTHLYGKDGVIAELVAEAQFWRGIVRDINPRMPTGSCMFCGNLTYRHAPLCQWLLAQDGVR